LISLFNENNKSQLVQEVLKQKNIDHRLLSETPPEANKDKEALKKRLIEAYQRQVKSKSFQKEMALWDSASGDEL
jgi:hypothetical protein